MSKEIMAVKKQVRLENWAAEVESCTSSGLTLVNMLIMLSRKTHRMITQTASSRVT